MSKIKTLQELKNFLQKGRLYVMGKLMVLEIQPCYWNLQFNHSGEPLLVLEEDIKKNKKILRDPDVEDFYNEAFDNYDEAELAFWELTKEQELKEIEKLEGELENKRNSLKSTEEMIGRFKQRVDQNVDNIK